MSQEEGVMSLYGGPKNMDKVRKRENRCWYDHKLSQNHSDLLRYKKSHGTATKTALNAKRSYKRKLSFHIRDDPKAFHTYTRSKTKMKDTVSPMTDDFGNVFLDDGVNVKLLNEYFA